MTEQYYTIKEASELLRVSKRKITLLIESGKLKAKNIGLGETRKVYRIRHKDILKLNIA